MLINICLKNSRDFNPSASKEMTREQLRAMYNNIKTTTTRTLDNQAAAALALRKFKASSSATGGGEGMTQPSEVS
jgi:hypothetical protein